MEIWECLSVAYNNYMKAPNQNSVLQMRIASLPPVPTQERCFEIFNITVDSKIFKTFL